jgi:hypothetical protein
MRGPLSGTAAALAACLLLLNACNEGSPPAERVKAFCSEVRKGEPIRTVLARYEEVGLQPGGSAPDARKRLAGIVAIDVMTTINGVLAEPKGTPFGATRPVCAIYYADRLLSGDDRVILAEFMSEWATRY